MRTTWTISALLVVASLAACAQDSPYETALKQVLDSFDKIGAKLKTIEDADTAAAAKPDLRKAADQFVEARTKAAKLPQPEKAEKVRLEKIYRPKIDESMKKLLIEARRVEQIPGGKEALKEISEVFKKDTK